MRGRRKLEGRTIVEFPALLEVRLLGRSKMKTLRTILGHLRLLARLSVARLGGKPRRVSEGAAKGRESRRDAPAPDPEASKSD
jgi:hypothetical protein